MMITLTATEIERLTRVVFFCLVAIFLLGSCTKNNVKTDRQLIDKYFEGEEDPHSVNYKNGFGAPVPVAPDYYYRYGPTVPTPVVVYPPPGYRPKRPKVPPMPVRNESDQYYVRPYNFDSPDIYHDEGLSYPYLNESR